MRLQAFRGGSVRINGQEVALAAGVTWKAEQRADVARLLRRGSNQLEVEVTNDFGPPALWLAIDLPERQLVTDERWEVSWAGATPGPAALANAPMSGHQSDPMDLAPSSAQALVVEWKLLTAFASLSFGLIGAGVLVRRRWPELPLWTEGSPWPPRIALALIALLWEALFLNNARALSLGVGFDAGAHLQYVRHLLAQRTVPFADEGWQMFQPPLYYGVIALALAAVGTQIDGTGAALIVRILGLATGVAHLAVVAAGLRLLFPRNARSQVLGLIVAGFLPCMLSMHQFIGNEPLMAAFAGGALLVTLHSLRRPPRILRDLGLGALLGLAILTKVSALLLLPPIFGALLLSAIREKPGRRRRLIGLMATSGTLLTVCGWYFVRVWQRFGTPFMGGWDQRRGFAWWQDPGYRTVADFLRFGHVFSHPVYAGFNGFWDGLYATMWGDGLLSGQVALGVPYHWSISLMSAELALAVLPCVAILVGAAATLVSWASRPSAADGMLLGLAVLLLAAMALMTLRVPSPSSTKASYGLLALLALGAFAARGLERAMNAGRWASLAIATALGTWALSAFATHWIKSGWIGNCGVRPASLVASGLSQKAPTYTMWTREEWAARPIAELMVPAEGRRDYVPPTQQGGPSPAEISLCDLCRVAELHECDDALVERPGTPAVCLGPADCARLATALEMRGKLRKAEYVWREVLRFEPQSHHAHRALASLYARTGQREAAARHLEWSKRVARALVASGHDID